MDPRYSAEAEAYREKIQAFLSEHLPSNWQGVGAIDADKRDAWVEEWRQRLVDNNLIAPAWPQEYGGGGLSAIERVVLHEEFAKAAVPTGGPNDGFGMGMIGPTIMVMGTEEQKKHFLPRILTGQDRWCQGYSEPNSGSDLASLGTQPCSTATSGSSTARRSGPPRATRPTGSSCCAAPTPTPRSTRASPSCCARSISPASRSAQSSTSPAATTSTRSSSATPAPPKSNVVGGVNEGWRVANQLLAFERGDDATTVSFRMRRRGRRVADHRPRTWPRCRPGHPPAAGVGAFQGRDPALSGSAHPDQGAERRSVGPGIVDQQAAVERVVPEDDRAGDEPARPRRHGALRRRVRFPRSPPKPPAIPTPRSAGSPISSEPARRRSTRARTRSSATSSANGSWACPKNPAPTKDPGTKPAEASYAEIDSVSLLR